MGTRTTNMVLNARQALHALVAAVPAPTECRPEASVPKTTTAATIWIGEATTMCIVVLHLPNILGWSKASLAAHVLTGELAAGLTWAMAMAMAMAVSAKNKEVLGELHMFR